MGERKVLNKYYPPDFDPANIPKRTRPKNMQCKIRMMLPMSLRCNTCGEFMYQGKKFNSRKELVENEDYLGIKIFRFYMKCIQCSAEFTIKTDPKNTDYQCEAGASRNFEPWRGIADVLEKKKEERKKEEENDSMKALENRTVESKREMDILDALQDLKMLNARAAAVDPDAMLDAIRRSHDAESQRHDAAVVAGIRFGVAPKASPHPQRPDEDDDEGDEGEPNNKPSIFKQIADGRRSDASCADPSLLQPIPVVWKKKKKKKHPAKRSKPNDADPPPAGPPQDQRPSVLGGLADYGDDE